MAFGGRIVGVLADRPVGGGTKVAGGEGGRFATFGFEAGAVAAGAVGSCDGFGATG